MYEPVYPLGQRAVPAIYTPGSLSEERGNPFLEALPEWEEDDVIHLITKLPEYDESMRNLSNRLRKRKIMYTLDMVLPLPLLTKIEEVFANVLRAGYVNRNPLHPGFLQNITALTEKIDPQQWIFLPQTGSHGFFLTGTSGMGKSTTFRRLLPLYPQSIDHGEYNGRHFTHRQLVWLKIECPKDGLLSGFCENVLVAMDECLGTDYHRKYGRLTQDKMLVRIAMLAALHHLGALIVDEIQNLRAAPGQKGEHFFNFLVQLDNILGIPIILIGTPVAKKVLRTEFREARRAQGVHNIEWDRMSPDGSWKLFINMLWKYQYIKNPSKDEQGIARQALYDCSQGITDLAVKLFLLAQSRIIESADTPEDEWMNAESIRITAERDLGFTYPLIEALRTKNETDILRYGDLGHVEIACDNEGNIKVHRVNESETASSEMHSPRIESSLPSKRVLQNSLSIPEPIMTQTPMIDAMKLAKREKLEPYNILKHYGFACSALAFTDRETKQ